MVRHETKFGPAFTAVSPAGIWFKVYGLGRVEWHRLLSLAVWWAAQGFVNPES